MENFNTPKLHKMESFYTSKLHKMESFSFSPFLTKRISATREGLR